MNRQSRIADALQRATDTKVLVIGGNVLGDIPNTFLESFGARSAIVVADETTFAIAGREVQERLAAAGIPTIAPFVFPAHPPLYADYAHVQKLEAALRKHDAIPVAVGSGTLNDLTKLASHFVDRPYMVVATAASMDGYTAFGAAITRDGFKQTFSCPAPRAVVADLDILKNAPPRMTASGYADLLGKITAGADWIIADTLEIEPIDPVAWEMVQTSLRGWIADPAGIVRGETSAMESLVEGLMLTGLAMQSYRSSRPASGSEHQFSHLWEMEETEHSAYSHGFKVGIGSIAVAALYESLLTYDLSHLDIPTICRDWPTRTEVERSVRASFAPSPLQEHAVEQSLAKYVDATSLAQHLTRLHDRWPTLRGRLQAQLLPAEHLRDLLASANGFTHPQQIGKSLSQLKSSYGLARRIRSRYTVFDLAAETGCFDGCIDELFAPAGFWPMSPLPKAV
jgi:glycerol-1-phosphate dehydrogenase [NAD(P)+]